MTGISCKDNDTLESSFKGKIVTITLNDNSVIERVVVTGFVETPYATQGSSISHLILNNKMEIHIGKIKNIEVLQQ